MKYCPKCGKQIEEEVKFCPHCGYDATVFSQVTQDNLQHYPQGFDQQGGYPSEAGKGLAIGSLICGLLVMFVPWSAILAITLGFFAKIQAAEGNNPNTGMATAGIILGVIMMVLSAIAVVALFIFTSRLPF